MKDVALSFRHPCIVNEGFLWVTSWPADQCEDQAVTVASEKRTGLMMQPQNGADLLIDALSAERSDRKNTGLPTPKTRS